MINCNICTVGTGALIALALVGTPANAQDKDFWSDTQDAAPAQSSDDDFWSDKASTKPAASDDFWSKSSAGEVQRRRQAVLAEQAAERRRAEAERKRKRQLAEMERLREEERQAELAYQRQRASARSSNGGGNMGAWGDIAAAAQVFAGVANSEINKLEAQNARNGARLAAQAAETRRRQASADRSRRLAKLERQAEQTQAAARQAERDARAARESRTRALTRTNSTLGNHAGLGARRVESHEGTSNGASSQSSQAASVGQATAGPRYRFVGRTISPVENQHTYGSDETAKGMLKTRVNNAAADSCKNLNDGFGHGWVEFDTITYRHWTGGRRPEGTGKEDPTRFWWRAESIRFKCRVPQR